MITSIEWVARQLAATPGAWVVALGALGALLASVGAHLALPRARGSRAAMAIALGPALVLVPAAIAGAAVLASGARRRRLADAIVGAGFDPFDPSIEIGWLGVSILLVLVLVPITGGALARAASSRGLRWLAAGTTLCITAAAMVASAYAWGIFGILYEADRRWPHPRLLEELAALDRTLALGVWVVAAFGAVTAIAAVHHRSRERRLALGIPWLAGAGLMFAVGLAAFLATRDHAWDRRHPQRLSDHSRYRGPLLDPVEGPRARCWDLEIAPVLEVREGALVLDGRRVPTPDHLAEELATLRRNWTVLHPREPFAVGLVLRAQPDVELATLLPYLRRALAGGYLRLFIDATVLTLVSTRTLGVVRARRICPALVDLVLGAGATPATVGDLVREVWSGREALAIEPP